jgi:RHS repeat-associated protein
MRNFVARFLRRTLPGILTLMAISISGRAAAPSCPGDFNIEDVSSPPCVLGDCFKYSFAVRSCQKFSGAAARVRVDPAGINSAGALCSPQAGWSGISSVSGNRFRLSGKLNGIPAGVTSWDIFFGVSDQVAPPASFTTSSKGVLKPGGLEALDGGEFKIGSTQRYKATASGCDNTCLVPIYYYWLLEDKGPEEAPFPTPVVLAYLTTTASGLDKAPYEAIASISVPMDIPCGDMVRLRFNPFIAGNYSDGNFSDELEDQAWRDPTIELVSPAADPLHPAAARELLVDLCNGPYQTGALTRSCGCKEFGEFPQSLDTKADFGGSGLPFTVQPNPSPTPTVQACGADQNWLIAVPTPIPSDAGDLDAPIAFVAQDADGVEVRTPPLQLKGGYPFHVAVSSNPAGAKAKVSALGQVKAPSIQTKDTNDDFRFLAQVSSKQEVHVKVTEDCYEDYPGKEDGPYKALNPTLNIAGDELKVEVDSCSSKAVSADLLPKIIHFSGRVVFGSQVNTRTPTPAPTACPSPGCGPTAVPTPDPACDKNPDALVEGDPICKARVTLGVPGGNGPGADTDENGHFDIYFRPPNISEAEYSLSAVKDGFQIGAKSAEKVKASSCSPEPEAVTLKLYDEPKSCPIGNPVNPLSGEKLYTVTELSIPGAGGLDFSFARVYRGKFASKLGPLGYGWTHNWDISLARLDANYILHFSDGEEHLMVPDPAHAGAYKGAQGFFYTMNYENGCWALKDGSGNFWHFNHANYKVFERGDRFGNKILLSYDGLNRLAQIVDASGRGYSFSYLGNDPKIAAFTAPNAGQGGLWTYAYVADELRTVTGPGPGTHPYAASYQYTAAHLMSKKDDPKSPAGTKHLSFEYDVAGRVSAEKRPDGSAMALFSYGQGVDKRDTVVTLEGYTTTHLVDDYGRVRGNDVNGVRTLSSYDYFNQGVTRTVDSLGHVTTMSYNPGNRGELASSTDPSGLQTSYQYDSYGFGIVTQRDEVDTANPSNPARHYTALVDSLGRITQSNDNGRVTTYTYGPEGRGQWTEMEDADHAVTRREFDASGLLAALVDVHDNLRSEFSYDAWGRLHSTKNMSSGALTVNDYDGFGNLVGSTASGDGGSSTTSVAYNAEGLLESRTDENLGTTTYIYSLDGRDHLETETGPNLLYTKTFVYDPSNNLLASETLSGPDGLGGTYTQSTAYDYIQVGCGCSNPGKLQKVTVSGARVGAATQSLVTRYAYDDNGNRTDVTDPKNNVTHLAYDGSNRVTDVTSAYGTADARTLHYTYDAFGNRWSVRDGKNQTTTFDFDARNQLAAEIPASGPNITYGYSAAGKLNSKVDRNGKPWSALYDDAGRMGSETFKDFDNSMVTLGYIYGSPGDGTEQLKLVNDPAGQKTFGYGHKGRLATETFTGLGRTLGMQYDGAGNMVTMSLQVSNGTAPAVSQVNLVDSLNRATQVTNFNGDRFNYFYDAAGQIRKVEFRAKQSDNSLALIATGRADYDAAGRLLGITYRKGASLSGTIQSKVTYSYDEAGNRSSRNTLSTQAAFGTNHLNELTSEANSADIRGNETFGYDNAGNRSLQSFGGLNRTHNFGNSLNRLASATGASPEDGDAVYLYDLEGNRIKQAIGNASGQTTTNGDTIYFWDGKARLRKAVLPDGTQIIYGYDYTGHRVSRQLVKNGRTVESRSYLYSGNQVVEETLNGQRLALYSWGPDGLIARTEPNGHSLFYLKDGLGSVMAIIDEKANIVQSYEYSAFGLNLSGKDAVNQFQFAGGLGVQTDMDTGLELMGARWYDPTIGRFISEDPIRWSGSDSNMFRYAFNNPVLYTDPSGLDVYVSSVYAGLPEWLWQFYNSTGLERPRHTATIFVGFGGSPYWGDREWVGEAFPVGGAIKASTESGSGYTGSAMLSRSDPGNMNQAGRADPELLYTKVQNPYGNSKEADDCLKKKIREAYDAFPDNTFIYKPISQNSNSFTGTILRKAGVNMSAPSKAFGWDTQLNY